MTEFDNQRLWDQLKTLRHLPPSAALPRSRDVAERELLEELLALPDGVDPVQWLQEERGPLTARITLWRAVKRMRQRINGLRRGIGQGGMPTPAQEAVFGNLIHELPAPEELRLLDDAAGILPETAALLRLLQAFRRVRGRPAPALPPQAALDPSSDVVPELLLLPEHVDPLEWLQLERGEFSAVAALRQVLSPYHPPRTRLVGATVATLNPRERVRAPGIEVVIDSVVFGETGISVAAHATFSTRRLHRPPGVLWRTLRWGGFDRAFNDLGYHYLRQNRQYQGWLGLLPWRWHESIEMAFYPAIAPGARELALVSNPVLVDVVGWSISGVPQTSLGPLNFGRLEWKTAIPSGLPFGRT